MPSTSTRNSSAAKTSVLALSLGRDRLRNNIGWTLSGNLIYSASQWAMIVILARWTDPGTVGNFAFALAVTAPITIFFNMQLRAVLATDHAGLHSFSEYLRTRALTSLAGLFVIAIAVAALRPSASTAAVILLIGLSKAVESITDIIHGQWQLLENMEIVGKSLILRGLLTLAVFAAGVIGTRSLPIAAAALLTGSVCVLLGYDCRRLRDLNGQTDDVTRSILPGLKQCTQPEATWAIVRRTLPLGLAATLISLHSTLPRYFIEAHQGTRELGIFAALSYFVVAGNMVVTAVGQCALPKLARLYSTAGWMDFQRACKLLVCFVSVLGALTMLVAFSFGDRLLALYGPEYLAASTLFLVLMAAGSLGYVQSALNLILNAIGSYDIQTGLFLLVTIVLIIACRIGVPRYGAVGAAMSLVAASCVQVIVSALIVLRDTRSARQSA